MRGSAATMSAPSRSGVRWPKRAIPTLHSTWVRPIASGAACWSTSRTAQTWLERAAEKGHVDAQTTLGLLLFQNGNQADGLKWLKGAAEKGDPRAMLVYGTALYNGDGVPQDPVLGYAYVSRSAAQGLEPARNTLRRWTTSCRSSSARRALPWQCRRRRPSSRPSPSLPRPARPKAAKSRASACARAKGCSCRRAAPGGSSSEPFRNDRRPRPCSAKLSGSAPVAGRRQFLRRGGVSHPAAGRPLPQQVGSRSCVQQPVR